MPHGGYHGTIKVGGNVVQSGGGGYKPQGNNKKSNNSIKKVNSGNARDDYRANQGYRAQQQKAFEQQQAEMNRGSIQRMANKGVINRSDFKGGAARLAGESPQDYAKFMQALHKSNPAAMQKAFPFSSGAMTNQIANFIPGMNLAKGITGFFNKGKQAGSAVKSGVSTAANAIKNGIVDLFDGNTTTDPASQGIRTLPENMFEQQDIAYPQQNMNMNLPVENIEEFSRIFNFPGNQNYGGREIFATNQLPGLETFSEEDIMNMPYDSFYRTDGDLITRMNDGTVNRASGGYMSSFPNQNLNTESLSASDNIDDRIMKNLQFENQSRGTYGTGF